MVSQRGAAWTADEIDAVVGNYFEMLRAELAGQPYVKVEFNRRVQDLTGRPKGSVERKFQNISAILLSMGAGFVNGYKPLGNVQQALREAVTTRWMAEPDIEDLMIKQATQPLPSTRAELHWNVSGPPVFAVDATLKSPPASAYPCGSTS